MSSELIKVTVQNDQQLVSARDLYKGLGLKGRFSRWVDNNFDLYTENEDFYKCTSSTVVGNGAKREIVDYALTISMAKPLTAWTQRGRRLIYEVLKENGLLPLIERGDVD